MKSPLGALQKKMSFNVTEDRKWRRSGHQFRRPPHPVAWKPFAAIQIGPTASLEKRFAERRVCDTLWVVTRRMQCRDDMA